MLTGSSPHLVQRGRPMIHNDHVVLFRFLQAKAALQAGRYWAYEILREWHEDELRAGGLLP